MNVFVPKRGKFIINGCVALTDVLVVFLDVVVVLAWDVIIVVIVKNLMEILDHVLSPMENVVTFMKKFFNVNAQRVSDNAIGSVL